MNRHILNIEIQDFINKNLNSNLTQILLKGTSFNSIKTKEVIEQIIAKKRCKTKLPTWFNTPNIYYPNKVNIEQSSSEITAKYKSRQISGDSIVDITGGFGVDTFYFSKQFVNVTSCEINKQLSEIVNYNYNILGVENIETINWNGIDYIKTTKKQYDWIYTDPSRRHDSKGKVFLLKDCLPNIPEHLDMLFEHSKNIMIKTSPLLDISMGIKELKYVKSIHVIALNNEVKELLWMLEKKYIKKVLIKTVNLKKDIPDYFDFTSNDEDIQAEYSKPLTYLYEPNAAILKAGGFNIIANNFKLNKLHKHSHLYTNADLIDFPGRIFKIQKIMLYNKRKLKQEGITKANITTRNFPETVKQIREKYNIKDGGDNYMFFTTNVMNEKIVLLTYKIDNGEHS